MLTAGLPDQLARALQKHRETTDAICESLSQGWDATPKIIYHYTDDRGLRGILSTGRLWFTDLFDLNDPSELRHGIGHAQKILDNLVKDGPPEARKFAQKFARALNGNLKSVAHHFVCCFSKTSDDLGQWRAYADDGRGYAIGFDASMLEKALRRAEKSKTVSYSTFPVVYDDKKMRQIHTRLVDATMPVISMPRQMNSDRECIDAFMQSLQVSLASCFFEVSMQFKHEAYRSEQEYRFLETYPANKPIPNLQLRSRPYSLVRYREFDWMGVSPEAIREVVCGPASDGVQAFKFVHDCLREYLPAVGPTIRRSEIPYLGRLG